MSKRIQFPSGHIGDVSDKVADVLLKRKGHTLAAEPEAEAQPVNKNHEKKNREKS